MVKRSAFLEKFVIMSPVTSRVGIAEIFSYYLGKKLLTNEFWVLFGSDGSFSFWMLNVSQTVSYERGVGGGLV